jgi:hypothetical protein
MGCHTKTKVKIMASIRRKHPTYGLARRKKMVSSIVYGRGK